MKQNSKTLKQRREYARSTSKSCLGRGSHEDALALVERILDAGGKIAIPHEEIARALGWEQRIGSIRRTDMARYQRARNHIRDGRTRNDEPCTGYSLHYRTSGRDNEMWLVDPSGDLKHHQEIAIREILGDLQQQVAFRTINGRRVDTARQAAQMFLNADPRDDEGHRLMTGYAIELEKYGTASDQTIQELIAWMGSK